jgi:hypothetical protein
MHKAALDSLSSIAKKKKKKKRKEKREGKKGGEGRGGKGWEESCNPHPQLPNSALLNSETLNNRIGMVL